MSGEGRVTSDERRKAKYSQLETRNSKLRIAIFHCWFVYSGGGERIVFEEALGLRNRGYEVEVYATYIDPQRCFPHYVEQVKPKTFIPQISSFIPLGKALTLFLTSVLAPLLVLRFKDVDLFVGENQPGAWLAYIASKILRKQYLVYFNQPNRIIYPREIDRATVTFKSNPDWKFAEFPLFKPIIRYLDMVSVRGADTLLTNGSYIGNIISYVYQKVRTDCPAGCHPQPKENLMVDKAYEGNFKINRKKIAKPYLLIAGRHEAQKKFEDVIRALALIKEQLGKETPQLVIPGPFTYHTRELAKLTEKLGLEEQVLFLGQVTEEDLQKLYCEAAIHCYPSYQEDFGMSPLEAAAWGVPTVAWDNAGPTVTIVSGVTGFLAKPFDVDDYAVKLLTLLKHPKQRAKMGWAAWERAKKEFSWEKHVDILEKAVLDTLKDSNGTV